MKYDLTYTNYQLRRSKFRKIARKFYLHNICRLVKGKSIDFGCGTGELLEMLPENSIGLDINRSTINYLLAKGLNVRQYYPNRDDYRFSFFVNKDYKTFIMSHVLEHFKNAEIVLKKILKSCRYLNIDRVIIIVPNMRNYRLDDTHCTFIDEDFFEENNLYSYQNYIIKKKYYFPINIRCINNIIPHNDLVIFYEKQISKKKILSKN